MVDSLTFKQRRFLNWMTFQIVEDGVACNEKGLHVSRKLKVPFENISKEPRELTMSSTVRFWLTIAFIGLMVLMAMLNLLGEDIPKSTYAVWGTLAIFAAISYLLSRETFLVYGSQSPALVVYKGRPSKAAVETFIDEVQLRKRGYLVKHYLVGGPGSSADAIAKLNWLRKEGAVTDTEFEALKAEVMKNAQRSGLIPPSAN